MDESKVTRPKACACGRTIFTGAGLAKHHHKCLPWQLVRADWCRRQLTRHTVRTDTVRMWCAWLAHAEARIAELTAKAEAKT